MISPISGQPLRPPRTKRPDSVEFKVLLDETRFDDPGKALKKLFKKLDQAADQAGVEIERDDSKDHHLKKRTTTFIDTPDHALKKQGFILRQRRDSKADEVALML